MLLPLGTELPENGELTRAAALIKNEDIRR